MRSSSFRLEYPNLLANYVLAGNQDRVIESAQWMCLVKSKYDRVLLDQRGQCYSLVDHTHGYFPPITERLKKLLSGVGLVDDDTHGALYACAYDLAAYGTSPCFTLEEIEDFVYVEPASPGSVQLLLTYSSAIGYELDLLMDGAFGYNLPDEMDATLGVLYVNTLVERFTNSSGNNTSAVYLEFGHDTTIDLALTGPGLAK
ncbi:hypothetical protein PILCRDRAFT_818666 [Piloderma croceum F 1598]|uniref:3-phytase n=1 Tax=Piloderma croceum (strain F 1598) TaxID=765440 RepID=A0A0C3BDC1_PILCF|nr:hypothetical protein PILCRDRAFT_818666 [Piloderma croceum F 1598]